jgi:peptidyl-tRNA hydrolase, PTH1 family
VNEGWLVVGLGNPGPAYAGHRHNIGHDVVDLLAERMGARFKRHLRARSDLVEGRVGGVPGTKAVLAKPRSYMNESGGPVSSTLNAFKLQPDHLIVIHDELDIPYGTLRLKKDGGDNGHNGLKSIRRSIGTCDYYRVRFGIGRPPGRQDPADFVLSGFSSTERKELAYFVDRAADAVEALIEDGLEKAQNSYHG